MGISRLSFPSPQIQWPVCLSLEMVTVFWLHPWMRSDCWTGTMENCSMSKREEECVYTYMYGRCAWVGLVHMCMHYGFVYTSICEEMCDVWYGLSLGRGACGAEDGKIWFWNLMEVRMRVWVRLVWWGGLVVMGWWREGWLWDGETTRGNWRGVCITFWSSKWKNTSRLGHTLWKGGSVADGAAGGGGGGGGGKKVTSDLGLKEETRRK